jgi:hypothetical protein
LRTISDETKTRLLREADEKYGWQLKKITEEVARVKTQTQTRMERLAAQKSTLAAEVKAVTKSKEEGMRALQMVHWEHAAALMDQVKACKKLSMNHMHEEKE